jgi:hypothetical protein
MTYIAIHYLIFDVPCKRPSTTKCYSNQELQLGMLDEAWPLYATTTIDLMNKIPYLNYVLKSVGVREMVS